MTQKLTAEVVNAAEAAALLTKEVYDQLRKNGFSDMDAGGGQTKIATMAAILAGSIISAHQ